MATNLSGVVAGRDYGKVSALDVAVAYELGCSPGTIHQRRHGHHRNRPNEHVAAVVRNAIRLGNLAAMEAELRPIEAAKLQLDLGPLTTPMIHEAQAADLREDEAENDFICNPTRANRRRWGRKTLIAYTQSGVILASLAHMDREERS